MPRHQPSTTYFAGFTAAFVAFLFILPANGRLDETERRAEYHSRGHVWPPGPEEFRPNTPGWRKIFKRRLRQVERISDDPKSLYNGYLSSVHCGLLCPNFTENGWALTRAPQPLVDDLRRSLHAGLAGDLPEEALTQCIEGEKRPRMVAQEELNQRALRELQHIHEAWAGVKLIGNNAYGLRIYRNESGLNMHIDKTETHIISSILHVDHDPMGDPWPIVIEDYQGNLNEVTLEPGDMLLYESSKCFHGRPKPFNGLWYSSLFIHYYPEDWDPAKIKMDAHYRVPPDWTDTKPREEGLEKLVVIDTSVKEPECEYGWCGMKETVKLSGPPEYGKVLSVGGTITPLLDLHTKEHTNATPSR